MRAEHIGLITLVLTACRGDTTDQIAALQLENDALTEELATLTATVDALSTGAASQQTEVTALSDEIDALTGLELSDLLADVADLDSRVTEIEAIDIASEGWVADQGYGLAADIGVNSARIDALDGEQDQQDASIASNTSLASGNSTTLAEQALDIDNLNTSAAELTSTLGAVQSFVSGNTQSSATNAAAIADLQTATQNNQSAISDAAGALGTDITDLATRVTAAEDAIGGGADDLVVLNRRVDALAEQTDADVDTLLDLLAEGDAAAEASRDALDSAIRANLGRITSLESDLSDTFDLLADAIDDVDEKVLGGYPALLEYQGVGASYNGRIAQGRGGFLLQTSGGGFSLSGYSGLDYTGGINRVWTVTWYVDNPSASPVSIDWTMCRGDGPTVLLDGVGVASPTDLDGRCEGLPNLFTIPPGQHTVQIRYVDTNNWLEGLGVTNAWMADNGLSTDWDGFKSAMELGVDR